MDNVLVGAGSIVGAMSFVKAGQIIEPGSLWAGVPAKFLRPVSDQERQGKQEGTAEYQALTQRCLARLSPCEPLLEAEADRPRLPGTYTPPSETRRS